MITSWLDSADSEQEAHARLSFEAQTTLLWGQVRRRQVCTGMISARETSSSERRSHDEEGGVQDKGRCSAREWNYTQVINMDQVLPSVEQLEQAKIAR